MTDAGPNERPNESQQKLIAGSRPHRQAPVPTVRTGEFQPNELLRWLIDDVLAGSVQSALLRTKHIPMIASRALKLIPPPEQAPRKHRTLGFNTDPERCIERPDQTSCRFSVAKVHHGQVHSSLPSNAQRDVGPGWQTGKHDVAALRQIGSPGPKVPRHAPSRSCTSTNASRSITWSAIAVNSGVCDT